MKRTCTRCGEEKVASDFYRNQNGKVTSHCKPCVREQRHAHYVEHREAKIAAARDWKRANRDAAREINRREYRKNSARKHAYTRKYRRDHPAMDAARAARVRAQLRQATPRWANKTAIRAIYDDCADRTRKTGRPWHVDHIVPTNSPLVCGLHVEHNLRVILGAENRSKSNRAWPDMP